MTLEQPTGASGGPSRKRLMGRILRLVVEAFVQMLLDVAQLLVALAELILAGARRLSKWARRPNE